MKDKCDKDCSSCSLNQQSYCSAQMICNMQDVLEEIKKLQISLSNSGNEQLISIDRENAKINDIVNEKTQD